MATYLDEIVAYHRRRAGELSASGTLRSLEQAASQAAPARPFTASLAGTAPGPEIAVIAEIKRRSPSKGDLAPSLDPSILAAAYERGGASCLSVLTDGPHFAGSRADLEAARSACSLPVLRKDFTVCEADVLEARAMGADAVLLIVAALSPGELGRFAALADALGMAALVEVHDERELEVALGAGASLVGVNQRDLRTFAVDRERAVRLASSMPAGVVKVAESGIRGRQDVVRLADAGFEGILVGEALVTAADPCGELRALRGVAAGKERLACS